MKGPPLLFSVTLVRFCYIIATPWALLKVMISFSRIFKSFVGVGKRIGQDS
jgi:hypothetical protein